MDGPVIGPVAVRVDDVPPEPARRVQAVAADRARRRAPVSKPKSPERVFKAEISRGELPSLRAIKARMHVGTDRARAVRDEIATILQEMPQAA